MPDEFCDGPRDEPELGPARPKIALSLSGGGFRATFFHLGVVACLRDAQLLSDVKVITSVSGGSILAGHLAVNWDSYAGSPEEFEKAATKLVQFAGSDLRNKILRTWMLALVTFVLTFGRWMPSSRKVTSILQKQYGQLYGDADLRMLGPTLASPNKPRFHVLATSMTSGDLCVTDRHKPATAESA